MPPKNDPTFLVLDNGNTNLKSGLMGKLGYEDLIPYAIQVPTRAVYAAKVTRAKYRTEAQDDTVVFEMRHRSTKEFAPYIVGEEAQRVASSKRLTGADKYQEGIWDTVFCAKALRHFPKGHDNLVVSVAHPPDAISSVDTLMDLIGGSHTVKTLQGDTVKFVVRHVVPWDEPSGGLIQFMHVNNQASNAANLADGDYILVLDIGGKISSMTPVRIGKNREVKPIFNQAPVFNLGIQDVLRELVEELRSLYPDTFRGFKDIPTNMLEAALEKKKVKISNKPFDVTEAVLNATAPILDRIAGIYADRMDSGKNFSAIVVSGGGGQRLFPYLASKKDGILKHDFIHMADLPDKLHLANLRGGMEALKVWVNDNYAKVYGRGPQ